MTTLIGSSGGIKGLGSQTHVRSAWIPKGEIHGVKAARAAAHDPASGGAITWDTVIWDTGAFITVPSTNIVVTSPGWYSIVGYVNSSILTAHYGFLQIMVNGAELHAARINYPYASGGFTAMNIGVAGYYLVKNDVVALHWDSNGVSLGIQTGGEPGASLAVWRIA
jgi:hypothetical protein